MQQTSVRVSTITPCICSPLLVAGGRGQRHHDQERSTPPPGHALYCGGICSLEDADCREALHVVDEDLDVRVGLCDRSVEGVSRRNSCASLCNHEQFARWDYACPMLESW